MRLHGITPKPQLYLRRKRKKDVQHVTVLLLRCRSVWMFGSLYQFEVFIHLVIYHYTLYVDFYTLDKYLSSTYVIRIFVGTQAPC